MPTNTAYQAVNSGTAPASIRWGLRAAQAISPSLAAWAGEMLFFTPAHRPVPADARPVLSAGRRFSMVVEGRRVEGWRWGWGPMVYLLHGWGGNAGRLATFIAPLREAGFAVVAFDAPGHGASGRGMSSMPEFARALRAVAAVYGRPHAVIAHSLGAAATGLAVNLGLRPDRLVLLAPPSNPAGFVYPFARALGLSDQTLERLKTRSERRLRIRWSDLDVRHMAPAGVIPLLVVHDQDDQTVPFTDGAAIARTWDGRLYQTTGLGHGGILRDPAVVSEVVSFLRAPSDVESLRQDDAAGLEWALYCREARW